jgi:hypothetical protein
MWPDRRRGLAGADRRTADAAMSPTRGGGLALNVDERLPWLESPDDDYDDETALDRGRLLRFVLIALAALALIVGGIWWLVRASGPGVPDGSLIHAEQGPYKVRPDSVGGKTFAGTGDSSYAVSEGENPGEGLAPAQDDGEPAQAATAGGGPAPASGGVGVQVGAYMDREAAETGWQTLVQRTPLLSGFPHRVVEGRADIGTLHRLQAVAGSEAAAAQLCHELRAAGQDCQVKP